MKIIGIIPARFGSTRFPGKPLVFIKGKTMVQRVYEGAIKSPSLDKVIVATDDERIYEHVLEFGEAMMTDELHLSGTDRCGEVMSRLDEEYDVVLNIQGDEPFINPEHIDSVAACFEDKKVEIATLAIRIKDQEKLFNANTPKVILDENQNALYFSRQVLPYQRGVDSDQWIDKYPYLKHIGLYGFRPAVLKDLVKLPIHPLEQSEALEQLRWLANGYKIKVVKTLIENHTIDTPEDLDKL